VDVSSLLAQVAAAAAVVEGESLELPALEVPAEA
jgi:hypothetical protein